MNVIVKPQKDYIFMHGLAEIIYLLPHFSGKIIFLQQKTICVYSDREKIPVFQPSLKARSSVLFIWAVSNPLNAKCSFLVLGHDNRVVYPLHPRKPQQVMGLCHSPWIVRLLILPFPRQTWQYEDARKYLDDIVQTWEFSEPYWNICATLTSLYFFKWHHLYMWYCLLTLKIMEGR